MNKDQNSRVLELASSLLFELADASSVSQEFVYDSLSHDKKTITTSFRYINTRLGTCFSEEEILSTLEKDHLSPVREGENFSVTIPSCRIDIGGEADISEEVIRLLGFSNVKSSLPDGASLIGLTEKQKKKQAVRAYLRSIGLNEVFTYTLVNERMSKEFAYLSTGENYRLSNPISDDREYVRSTLIPSLLSVAQYNLSRQMKDFSIFEVSDIDTISEKGNRLAAVFIGNKSVVGEMEKKPYSFYTAKGVFESICELLGINANRYQIAPLKFDKEEFHPGRSAEVTIGKKPVAIFGELHPLTLKKYDLGKVAVAMEIDLDALLELKTSQIKAVAPSKFPLVSRDLAFLVDKKVTYAELKREIARADTLVKGVDIFDVYEGDIIASGKKSVALSILFSDPSRTLKDEEVNAVMDKIIGILRMKFLAEVRK